MEKIIRKHNEGLTYREIQKQVYVWDKNRHKKQVSIGYISKVLNEVRE